MDAHVDALCAKVVSRLYFLQNPKAMWTLTKMLCFYKFVILSVVEYGCVVLHHNLTNAQSDRPEALQKKRALRIILHQVNTTMIQFCSRLL